MVLRTKTLAGPYVHVDVLDPAVDVPGNDAEEADRKRFAEAYARALETGDFGPILKTGETPVTWRFRHLSADEVAWLGDHSTGAITRKLDTLALALEGVSGVEEAPGKAFVLERERDPKRGGFLAAKRSQLDALLRDDRGRLDAMLLGRLSERIWSELSPRNG